MKARSPDWFAFGLPLTRSIIAIVVLADLLNIPGRRLRRAAATGVVRRPWSGGRVDRLSYREVHPVTEDISANVRFPASCQSVLLL